MVDEVQMTDVEMVKNENGTPLVYMENITQRFGLIEALSNVDFVLNRSEIVGLLGDNGAGKSTLIKVLTGIHTPSTGQIYFEGQPVTIESPKKARAMGIETVYQDLALVNLMSVARNFYLGHELERRIGSVPFLDHEMMNQQSVEALSNIGIDIRRPDEEVLRLSGGERQSIAIGRAVHFGSKLLILDEPTSALSVGETEKVLNYTREAKRAGLSVIFITHNIGHVYQVADRFTILSHGEKVGDFLKEEVNQQAIAEMIMGGPVPERLQPKVEERAIEIQQLSEKVATTAAPIYEEARRSSVRNRNIALAGILAAMALCALSLVATGAFTSEEVAPTLVPTPTAVPEIPPDVQANIDILLENSDPSQRALAASRLGNSGNPGVIESLIQALEDEDENVRRGAARAIGRIGIPDARAFEPLVELLRDNQSSVRDAAAETLLALFDVSCSASDPCPTPSAP